MQSMKNIKILIGLAYLIILSLFLYFLFSKFSFQEITTYNFIKSNSEYLVNIRKNNLVLISLFFIIFGILWVLLQGFGSPLLLASGFLFGSYYGTLISVLSLSIGATIIYIFANFYFRDLIKEKFLKRFINLEQRFKKKELFYMLVYRFIGGIPFQISNLIPCMFSISVRNFFLGTFFGIIPQGFIMASLGAGLENQIEKNIESPSLFQMITSFEIYAPILGFVFLLAIVFLIKSLFFKN